MAIEEKRGCGYRKVNGIYLVGCAVGVGCDRLPYRLEACPVCGAGIHFTRSVTEINPFHLMGDHKDCHDNFDNCYICKPPDDTAFIMMVGEKFYPTPAHFIEESDRLGISKRIPFIPRNLRLGSTIIYLAHNNACTIPVDNDDDPEALQKRMLDAQKTGHALGIFMAFKPIAIEMPVYKSKLTDEKKAELKKRGITPVVIPDGDMDHFNSKERNTDY